MNDFNKGVLLISLALTIWLAGMAFAGEGEMDTDTIEVGVPAKFDDAYVVSVDMKMPEDTSLYPKYKCKQGHVEPMAGLRLILPNGEEHLYCLRCFLNAMDKYGVETTKVEDDGSKTR